MEQLRNYFEFGQAVQEMSFNKISHLELWRPLSIAEQNHLCSFDREHYEEQVYQVISIWTSGSEGVIA